MPIHKICIREMPLSRIWVFGLNIHFPLLDVGWLQQVWEIGRILTLACFSRRVCDSEFAHVFIFNTTFYPIDALGSSLTSLSLVEILQHGIACTSTAQGHA